MAISKLNDILNQCKAALKRPKCILKRRTTVPSRLCTPHARIEKIKVGIAVGALVFP